MDDLLSSTLQDRPTDIMLASTESGDDNSDIVEDSVESRPMGAGSLEVQILTLPDDSESTLSALRKQV